MTLLANRTKAPASDNEATRQNGRQDINQTGRKISLSPRKAAGDTAPVAAPPADTLRTLQERLQAQLNTRDNSADEHTDPEARYLVQSVRRRLSQVNAALERIEEGKYGVCTDCEEPVENERLVLQPMSTRCTRCQAVAEWRGTAY